MSKVFLIIRDGWGYLEKSEGNAIAHANKPYDDYLLKSTPQVLLACHGESVGLPRGFQGSSEVGHMNMGAGRIVTQEVTRIFKQIKEGDIYRTERFKKIEEFLSREGSRLHLFGLLQDEGVHAHQEHLLEILTVIKTKFPDLKVWIHPIADGRDTPPRSFIGYFDYLKRKIASLRKTNIGTVWGRYYGMDRSNRWDLIEVAYQAMIDGKGNRVDDIRQAVKKSYESDLTPDNQPMFDEYLKPIISNDYDGIKNNDVIINFNYRQDRAIQISKAFMEKECPIYSPAVEKIHYYGLTQYYDEFNHYLISPISEGGSMTNLLGEVISKAGFKQLRIAETQKFRHVTSFFNGKRTQPYDGEDQIEVTSEYDPSSFASHPEMNAADVTDELLKRLDKGYEFIALNYANCDMVGHTGIFNAAKRGASFVDKNVQKVSEEALKKGYIILITADHGNSEEMIDEYGKVKTSHTTNPVKLHIVSKHNKFKFGVNTSILSSIGPLVLKLMNLDIPHAMTSRELADTIRLR